MGSLYMHMYGIYTVYILILKRKEGAKLNEVLAA